MTKSYLKFPPVAKTYLPSPIGRRFGGNSHFRGTAFLSDAEKAEQDALLDKIKNQVEGQLATRVKKEEIETIVSSMPSFKDLPLDALRSLADPKDGVMAKLVEQGLKIKELEARNTGKKEDMSTRAQVAKWYEANKAQIQAIRSGSKAELPSLELRVASPMLVSTVNAGTSSYIGRTEIEAGYTDFVRLPRTFWDFLPKGRTGSPTYVWVNKTNPLGAAGFIGPGVAKPGISLALSAETSVAKKIAAKAKTGTELLEDIDGMTDLIENELRDQLEIEINSKLMTGVSSSTVPAGIQTLSVAYTLATIKTTNPTYMDCIRAVIGQLRSGALQGDITVFVNSVDAANMDLSKASDSGVYLLPPFTSQNGQMIAGARIIEDNNIPVGYIQAGFMKYYRVLIYKDYAVSYGWENTDFTDNLITVIGEMRLHQFFNTQYTGAFVYDSFENVKSAITAP